MAALKWIIVELDKSHSGRRRNYTLVSERSITVSGELHTGKAVTVRRGLKALRAHIVMVSEDQHFLEEQLKILDAQMKGHMVQNTHKTRLDNNGPSRYVEPEEVPDEAEGDYSPSNSDWGPDEQTSSDSEVETQRRCAPKQSIKREYQASKKPRMPSLRAELQPRNSSIRNYSRPSLENVGPEYRFNALRSADSQEYKPQLYNKPAPNNSTPVMHTGPKNIMTFDQQSQTESSQFVDNFNLKTKMDLLQGEVSRLEQVLVDMQTRMTSMEATLGIDNTSPDINYDVREEIISDFTPNSTRNAPRVLTEVNGGANRLLALKGSASSNEAMNTSHSCGSEVEADSSDMVPIGSGKTLVPKNVYKNINWTSYTIATRKLLMAVFPRRTLATHSLTGKPSPAFVGKPAKLRLDMKKVIDIVMTVVENCGVREGLVRSCITTKCADENKMYRMRLQKKAKKSRHVAEGSENVDKRENTPPLPASSNDEVGQYTASPGPGLYGGRKT